MSLRAYSNRFLMLRNLTGIVVPCAFHSGWKLFAFDQIQLNAYFTVLGRRFEVTFKLRPVILIFERNEEMTECPRKSRQPTAIGITWHCQLFSNQPARSVSYRFFFHSCASSRFSSQETVNSMRKALLWIGQRYNIWPLFCLNNVSKKL